MIKSYFSFSRPCHNTTSWPISAPAHMAQSEKAFVPSHMLRANPVLVKDYNYKVRMPCCPHVVSLKQTHPEHEHPKIISHPTFHEDDPATVQVPQALNVSQSKFRFCARRVNDAQELPISEGIVTQDIVIFLCSWYHHISDP